ncbi:MAG: hypothetical protein JRE36_17030 [Deltaproteobacteria bacterium]|nr:hypothetical protein [Deltaproteobacteria bacterium]
MKGGNSKQRIVAVNITDTEAQNMVAGKQLRSIVKIIKSIGCHIIIGKGHKGQFSFRHQIGKMGVGDRQKLKPFGPATGFGS